MCIRDRISVVEESDEEIQSFIESLTTDQFDKIVTFVMNLPKLTKKVSFKCTNCEKDNEIIVEGLANFLS